jgi:hypothetical protein
LEGTLGAQEPLVNLEILKQCFSQTKSEALARSVLSNMIAEFSVSARAGYAMMATANGRHPCPKQNFGAKKYLADGG